ATPKFSGLHERLERIGIPLREVAGINRVHVAVERDHAFVPADAANDVAETVNADSIEADFLHLFLDDSDDVLFPGREGLSADEVGQKSHGVLLHRLGAFPDQVVGDRDCLLLRFRCHHHILFHKFFASSRARAFTRASSRLSTSFRFSISTRPPTMVVSASVWEIPNTRWPSTFPPS